MAVCLKGMTTSETADFTEVMANSGETLDLTSLPDNILPYTVDKHSTGGVGDKTSLVLAPLLRACGATVIKMSGRGLGHTGGTIDKLESIPNFKATLSNEEFLKQARAQGIAISAQSQNLAPADGKLYALRDVTATIDSLPLIASSIMSKKLAGGARSIVLDIKVGKGAFIKTLAEARKLAQLMISIGKHKGRKVRAVLSNMDVPLGFAIGNALEVKEAIDCLKGKDIPDLRELCLVLAEELLRAAGIIKSKQDIAQQIDNGKAYEIFKSWISYQGGILSDFDLSTINETITAPQEGYLYLDALKIGEAVRALGGGRVRKGQKIDLSVGILLHAKNGTFVGKGGELLTLFHNNHGLEQAKELVSQAVMFESKPVETQPLVLEAISKQHFDALTFLAQN